METSFRTGCVDHPAITQQQTYMAGIASSTMLQLRHITWRQPPAQK
jgi:hypothetical protein